MASSSLIHNLKMERTSGLTATLPHFYSCQRRNPLAFLQLSRHCLRLPIGQAVQERGADGSSQEGQAEARSMQMVAILAAWQQCNRPSPVYYPVERVRPCVCAIHASVTLAVVCVCCIRACVCAIQLLRGACAEEHSADQARMRGWRGEEGEE